MRALLSSLILLLTLAPARLSAHPHVFVDGGVDFVMGKGAMLEALRVTWLYDEFETLYILSSHDLTLAPDGTLSEADRQALIRARRDWPADFDGSAHPQTTSGAVALDWPSAPDLTMVDGRLQMVFQRRLTQPLDLSRHSVEVGFYESTYFFAFEITRPAAFFGAATGCQATLVKFDPDAQTDALRATLRALGREETPQTQNVGALFADRLVARCD